MIPSQNTKFIALVMGDGAHTTLSSDIVGHDNPRTFIHCPLPVDGVAQVALGYNIHSPISSRRYYKVV